LIIQVLDLSSSAVEEQAETVDEILSDLDAADKPRVVALNKVDLLGPASRRRAVSALSKRYPGAVAMSATNRAGLKELLGAIDQASRGDSVPLAILVPYGRGAWFAGPRRVGGGGRPGSAEGAPGAWGW